LKKGDQALNGVLAVAFLGAKPSSLDDEFAGGGDSLASQTEEPIAHLCR
jgi:hypothetical protein